MIIWSKLLREKFGARFKLITIKNHFNVVFGVCVIYLSIWNHLSFLPPFVDWIEAVLQNLPSQPLFICCGSKSSSWTEKMVLASSVRPQFRAACLGLAAWKAAGSCVSAFLAKAGSHRLSQSIDEPLVGSQRSSLSKSVSPRQAIRVGFPIFLMESSGSYCTLISGSIILSMLFQSQSCFIIRRSKPFYMIFVKWRFEEKPMKW